MAIMPTEPYLFPSVPRPYCHSCCQAQGSLRFEIVIGKIQCIKSTTHCTLIWLSSFYCVTLLCIDSDSFVSTGPYNWSHRIMDFMDNGSNSHVQFEILGTSFSETFGKDIKRVSSIVQANF